MADAAGLTDKLLEVLPVCPEGLKGEAIAFLPEIATEDNHEVRRRAGGRVVGGGRGGRSWGDGSSRGNGDDDDGAGGGSRGKHGKCSAGRREGGGTPCVQHAAAAVAAAHAVLEPPLRPTLHVHTTSTNLGNMRACAPCPCPLRWRQAVIRVLEDLMGQDSQLVLPSIEALANLSLTSEQQVGYPPPPTLPYTPTHQTACPGLGAPGTALRLLAPHHALRLPCCAAL